MAMPRRVKVEPPEPPPGWPSICGGAATCAEHVPKPEWEPRRGTWVARCDMVGPPPKCRRSYHHVFWNECLCVIFENDVFNVFLLTLNSGRANLCTSMYMSIHEFKISVAAYCSRSSFFFLIRTRGPQEHGHGRIESAMTDRMSMILGLDWNGSGNGWGPLLFLGTKSEFAAITGMYCLNPLEHI